MNARDAEINSRLDALESKQGEIEREIKAIHTAFVLDDLGRPGFDGHRNAHRKDIKRSQELDGIKMDVTKRLVQGVTAVVGLIMATGIMSYLAKGFTFISKGF